ncbi:MAG: hypothetical protein CVV24_09680 [Ignavibacteriae bacterium HGW-Ignavibacteriae-3]|nr:MAG: hypothetical protein CVV24_09680 [Ignavibacteriae bacterium HGW-Ignavibacteriae-3]
MKKILLILLLTGIILYPQENKNIPSIQLRMELKLGDYLGGIEVYQSDEWGFIRGSFDIGINETINHSKDRFDDLYFYRLSQSYYYKLANPDKEISKELAKELEKKSAIKGVSTGFKARKVLFSFYPMTEQRSEDSISFYCKYIEFKKLGDSADYNYHYNISYHETFCTLPIAQDCEVKIFNGVYPNLQVIISAKYMDWLDKKARAEKEGKIIQNLEYYENSIKAIEESIRDSKLGKTKFNIGFEYVRTDKQEKDILTQKIFGPLVNSNLAITSKEFFDFPINIYKGHIELPLLLYSKEAKELLQYVEKWRIKNFEYDIVVVPMDKNGNNYSFHVFFPQSRYIPGDRCFMKAINIGLGEKVKIKLEEDNFALLGRNADKEFGIFISESSKFINEYYILSLESDK